MADSYHHALSSVKRWGGTPEDYTAIHRWFDESKTITCDFRHRALRHHAEGIALCVQIFGPVLVTSAGREVMTRWIAEQHVREDFGRIPSFVDWVRAIKAEPWMGRVPKLNDGKMSSRSTPPSEHSMTEIPSLSSI
ncbi:MAG TPA: hypothetical protein VGU45_11895 [Microvirga sp.]|jgi:hypothetical protein|nr:hypothetical protein [Microvirga sp.]